MLNGSCNEIFIMGRIFEINNRYYVASQCELEYANKPYKTIVLWDEEDDEPLYGLESGPYGAVIIWPHDTLDDAILSLKSISEVPE